MIRISYDMPGSEMKTVDVDTTVVLVSWDSPKEGFLINSPVSLLVSIRNIGPCFGLFVIPSGTKKVPIRVAGSLIFDKEPENPSALIFTYRGVEYRVMVSFFKITKLESKYQCDFVINGIRPHNDPANFFIISLSADNINLENLKEFLSFGLTTEEEAIFNSEGGFTLRQIKPKEKKEGKVDVMVSHLNNPVKVYDTILKAWQAQNGSHSEPAISEVRSTFLKAWQKIKED
jgi:hypothetical protein